MDDLLAITKCRAGDWEAFRHLVETYQTRAVGHALAIAGNREDARDAVQEAFLDAFQALCGFDPERPFYPWFYTILRNRCFKLLANRKRHEADSVDQKETAKILAPSSSLSPEELLALEQALISLTAKTEVRQSELQHAKSSLYWLSAPRLPPVLGRAD